MNRIGLRTIARSSYRPVQITYRTVRHNSTAPPSIPSKSKFAKYIPHLDSISTKSGLPLPSLALSFAILHELTAIVPLVGIFFLFQALGIGGSILQWASHQEDTDEFGLGAYVKSWLAEGQKRVDKVARRYGLFGYDKMSKETEEEKIIASPEHALQTAAAAKQSRAAAGVANAVAAYIVVKAILPLRIAASIGLTPGFTRYGLEPFRRSIWHGLLRRPRTGVTSRPQSKVVPPTE